MLLPYTSAIWACIHILYWLHAFCNNRQGNEKKGIAGKDAPIPKID